MIYERKLLQSSSSKKVEPNLLVAIARYVTIVSRVILDKITLSVDCHRFKVILSYISSYVKFSPCSKCLSLVSSTQAHSSLRLWARTHANMPDLKEVISAWLVFSETLHPPGKFRLATQGSATRHEEITYTANQHMASEKKKLWDSPCRAQRPNIRVPVVLLWKWWYFTLTLFSLRRILFERILHLYANSS